MRERGDRFTELLSKVVDVTEDETFLSQRSGLTKAEHEEVQALAPEYADTYEKDLHERIEDFKVKLRCVEPLPVLAVFMMNNIFGIAGEYFEPMATGRESKVEFVASLLAALDSGDCSDLIEPSRELTSELSDDVEEIFELAHLANLARGMASNPRDARTDLRFRARAHRLAIRGSSYAEHGRELAKDVFEALPVQAVERMGFDIETLVDLDVQVTGLIERKVNAFLHRFKDRLIDIAVSAGSTPTQEQIQEAHALFDEPPTLPLTFTLDELEPKGGVFEVVLRTLSIPLSKGEGPDYSSPWDTSPLETRPFVRHGDIYMLPVPGILSREMATVLEPHVKPHLSKFEDWRAKRLDEIAVSHLQRMFPGSESWTGLYYWVEENGQKKRVELDGLVLYEGIAFILEGKANPLAPPSLRGDVVRLRNEIKKTVEKAFQQALRAKDYLLSGKVHFENESGDVVFEIDGASLDRVYMINPTLHELGDQAVQLGRFHELGLFRDGSLPFSVFINDLRVISEIVQVPMEFIHYLEWRSRLPLGTTVDVSDELDLFGSFLVRSQLDRMITTFGYMQIGNASTDFDTFFMGENRRAKDRPKMLMLVREVREFAARLAVERPEGWMQAVGTCLELSLSEMAVVSNYLRRIAEVPPGEIGVTVVDDHPEQDPNAGGLSIAVVALGRGRDRSEIEPTDPELAAVQRVVILRSSSRGRPMVDWAWTNTDIEVKLPLKSESD